MKRIFSISLLLFCVFVEAEKSQAQNSNRSGNQIIEAIAEMVLEESEEAVEFSDLLDRLEQIAQSPFNLNLIEREELEQLPFLNAVQINSLLEYLDLYGQIFSLNELVGIEGFNDEVVSFLAPFVYLGEVETHRSKAILSELNIRTMQTLEQSKGYQKIDGVEKYPGPRQKYYIRYKTSFYKMVDVGFTAENDAGEHFFTQSNKLGFDYYSGYVRYSGEKHLQSVVLGDFQARFGQGLIQWSGYGLRKSPEIARIRYLGQGILPYSSTDENGGMRGAAAQFKFNSFSIVSYVSSKKIDANISVSDEFGNPLEVSSIQNSGYHRTENEIADENALREHLVGLSVRYVRNRFSAGMNGTAMKYSVPLVPDDKPYNRFRFSGRSNVNGSFDFAYILNRTSLFGEAAISKSGGTGVVAGLEAQPSNEFSFTMLFRDYQRNFQSIKGCSFSESSTNTNERGIYGSFVFSPLPKSRISGCVDAYQSPWIKYTTCGPMRGVDTQFQFNYKPSKDVEVYLRLKNETNEEKTTHDEHTKYNTKQSIQRARVNASWQVSECVELRFRSEWSRFEKDGSIQNGSLVLADVSSKFLSNKLTLLFRLAKYNTDGYDARIYAYESDMPSMFSVPAYFGNGFRSYLRFGYALSSNLTFYGRFSLSLAEKGETFGSGDDFVDSNHKSDIRLQIRCRF